MQNSTSDESQFSDRDQHGWQIRKKIDGEACQKAIDSLQDIPPDLTRYVIELPLGDIFSRPGLDLKSREITAIAALTALGNAPSQLKVHVQAALNVGCSAEEIVAVIMQIAVYAGFPAALNGMAVAKQVFTERNIRLQD